VREDEVDAGSTEEFMEPRPRRTRFHDRLERPIRREQRQQPLWLIDPHPSGTQHSLTHLVNDDNHDIPCVNIQSGEEHVGLLVGMRTWDLGRPSLRPPTREANAL